MCSRKFALRICMVKPWCFLTSKGSLSKSLAQVTVSSLLTRPSCQNLPASCSSSKIMIRAANLTSSKIFKMEIIAQSHLISCSKIQKIPPKTLDQSRNQARRRLNPYRLRQNPLDIFLLPYHRLRISVKPFHEWVERRSPPLMPKIDKETQRSTGTTKILSK